MMRAHLTLLISLALLTSPLLAHAQGEDKAARAEEHYKAGVKAAIAEDYVEAIYQLKQGDKLTPNGLFSYNITIAYLRLDNQDEALRFARQTDRRAADLNDTQRIKNRARLHALRTHQITRAVSERIDIADAKTPSVATNNTANTAADASAAQDPTRPDVGPELSTPVADIQLKRLSPNARPRLIGGALIGGGLITGVAGSALGLSAANRWEKTFEEDYAPHIPIDADDEPRDEPSDYSVFDCDEMLDPQTKKPAQSQDVDNCKTSLKRAAVYGGLGKGALLLGGGMVVTGIVLLARHPRQPTPSTAWRFAPVLSRDAKGVTLQRRF